jgi:Outer membrane protein beta-barrel domain
MNKRISLITAMALCTFFSYAQQNATIAGGTSFGIKGGVNFNNIYGKNSNGDDLKNDILTAYNVGINVEIPVAPEFYFQPGVIFSVKGAKSKEVVLGQNYTSTTKISYAEVPLNFLYKPLLGNGHLLLGFGPYVAFGVGGKATYEGPGSTQTEKVKFKNTVKISDPNDVTYFKPFEAGAGLLAGYEFSNKLSFQLNAQIGLTEINPEYEGSTNDKTSAKNIGFGFSLGYRF